MAGYDLLNEPIDRPSSLVYWTLLDRCYRTIRTNDADHIIIMEATCGNWNFAELPNPSTYGWTNVVYQLHLYFWNDWTNTTLLDADNNNALQDWMNHQSWNVPCYMGEFNMGPEDAWKYAIERFSSAGASWSMWAYKSTFTGGQTSWGVYNPNGSVTAAPNIPTDSASTISNKWAQWATARAFSINPSHRRTLSMPVANDDTYSLVSGLTLTVAAPGVLGNDTHLNLSGAGIRMQALKVSDPAHGSVTLNTNGSFTYTAVPGYSGSDSFRYKVWDGRIDSVRIATVSILVASSQTNNILAITNNANGTLSLTLVGTPGVSYYLEAARNLVSPVTWVPILGSTNTVTNASGLWLYTITNITAAEGYYRSAPASH